MPIRLIIVVIFVMLISSGAYWFSRVDFVEDSQPPELIFRQLPKGLGLEASHIDLLIKDSGSGIDRFVVAIKQRGFSKELFRASLKGAKEYNFKQELIADRGYLVEGPAEIEFRVLDRSLSGNVNVQTVPIQIDFKKPYVSIVTSQHNLHLGGVQLAFYQVKENALEASGVRVGSLKFYGFPARLIEASLKDPELYAVLYSVPNNHEGRPRLFAVDLAGNYVESGFYNLVVRRRFLPQRLTVKSDSLRKSLEKNLTLEDEQDLSVAVEEARLQVNILIEEALKNAKSERMWRGTFTRPSGSVRTSFGSQVRYMDKGEEVLSALELGYSFSGTQTDNYVYATNSGEVIIAERVPFYGQIVVLNHGMRLNSLSGNLSEITVQVGERVHAGQVIGTRRVEGILGAGTFFYEMRLGGIPIEPREWWDQNWLKQHIDDKIDEMKVSFGQ